MKNYILFLPFLFLCTNMSAQTYTQQSSTNYESINSVSDTSFVCIDKKEHNKRKAKRLLKRRQDNELFIDVIGEFLVELTQNMKRKRLQKKHRRTDGTENYQRRPSN